MSICFTEQKKDLPLVSEMFIEQIGEIARTTLPKRSLMFLALSFILIAIASCGGNSATSTISPPPTASIPPPLPPPLPISSQPPTASNGRFRALKSVTGTSSISAHAHDGTGTPLPTMAYARYLSTSTLLADGRVLVTGGFDNQACEFPCNPSPSNYYGASTAEIFDPATETFSLLDSTMSWERVNHCAVVLSDNRVVVIGGYPMSWQPPFGNEDLPPTVDIFDPTTNTFSPQMLSGPLPDTTGADYAQCFLLPGNRVLINTAGNGLGIENEIGLMVLETNTWETHAIQWSDGPRPIYTNAAQTPDGKVWFVGGMFGDNPTNWVTTPNIWWIDPVTESISIAGQLLQARQSAGILAFPDNSIEVYGGAYQPQVFTGDAIRISSIERVDSSGIASKIGDLPQPKVVFTPVMLQNGKSLQVGGADVDGYATTTQYVFDESTHVSGVTGNMVEERVYYSIAPLMSGRILIVGGEQHRIGTASKTAEIFEPDASIYVLLPKNTVVPGEFMQLSAESSTPDAVTWATRFGTISTIGGYTAPFENPYGSASQVTTVQDEVAAMLPTGAQAIATITVQFPAKP